MYVPQLRGQLASVHAGANLKERGQPVGPCLDVCSKGLTFLILKKTEGRSTEAYPTNPPCCVCFLNGGPLLEGTIAQREHKHKSRHGQEIRVFNQAGCPEKLHSKVPHCHMQKVLFKKASPATRTCLTQTGANGGKAFS